MGTRVSQTGTFPDRQNHNQNLNGYVKKKLRGSLKFRTITDDRL
jgi:hypothetical protein